MPTALIIIDMQNGLCSGPEAGFEVDRVLKTINTLSERARLAGLPVMLVQHSEAGSPLQHGTPGWQLADGLVVAEADVRVHKKTPNAFFQTDLQAQLQSRGIDELIICGQQTDCCIDTTVRHALTLGYHVTLIEDGHTTVGNGILTAPQIIAHHNLILRYLHSFGPRMTACAGKEVKIS